MNANLKAVIFDMDGVIADSEPIHFQAEKDLFGSYGIILNDAELHAYMGYEIRSMLKQLAEKHHLNVDPAELYRRQKINLLKRMRNGVKPIPGSLELIRTIHLKGIPLGLATSSFRELADEMIDRFQIRSCFRTVVTVDDISRSKPDPEIFLKAASGLSVRPIECLVIEDSTNGVHAAKAAGMKCIGFNSSNSRNQNLKSADLIILDLRDLQFDTLRSLGLNG